LERLTYHSIETGESGHKGIQVRLSGVPKGEYWPQLQPGKYAAIVQLDDLLVAMSVVEKEDYFSPQLQLDTLIDGYLTDDTYTVKKVIAKGKVTAQTEWCRVVVELNGEPIASVCTYHLKYAIPFDTHKNGKTRQYYADVLNPEIHQLIYEKKLDKRGIAALVASLLPAVECLTLASAE